jgi:hypothetical protein
MVHGVGKCATITFSGFEFSFASGTAEASATPSFFFEVVRGAKNAAMDFCF